jgi:hypothetical protein
MGMLLGSCHCGTVVIGVSRMPRQLTDCNCSICRRYGALWAYYTRTSVKITAAPKAIDIYSWGHKNLQFCRCAGCGCVTHHQRVNIRPDSRYGINARMFEAEVIASLRIRHLDGAASWKYLD